MIENLTREQYGSILRQDFVTFAARCFQDLNPQTALGMNWHLEVIAAKLTSVREGKIRRLIINMSQFVDFIIFIFHPTSFRRPTASLDGSWVEMSKSGRAAINFGLRGDHGICDARWG